MSNQVVHMPVDLLISGASVVLVRAAVQPAGGSGNVFLTLVAIGVAFAIGWHAKEHEARQNRRG